MKTLEIGKRYWIDTHKTVSAIYVGQPYNYKHGHYFDNIQGDDTDYIKNKEGKIGFYSVPNFQEVSNA